MPVRQIYLNSGPGSEDALIGFVFDPFNNTRVMRIQRSNGRFQDFAAFLYISSALDAVQDPKASGDTQVLCFTQPSAITSLASISAVVQQLIARSKRHGSEEGVIV